MFRVQKGVGQANQSAKMAAEFTKPEKPGSNLAIIWTVSELYGAYTDNYKALQHSNNTCSV